MEPNKSWVLNDDNLLLRQKTSELILPVNKQDQKLIDRMVSYIDACYNNMANQYDIRSGIALAGPQVGLLKKVIYIHFDHNEIEYRYLLTNPKIIAESKVFAYIGAGEGCLSVDQDVKGIVKRRNKIVVSAYDLLNHKEITIEAEGILSICLQHEIDHLSGILYYDRINQAHPEAVDPSWIKY